MSDLSKRLLKVVVYAKGARERTGRLKARLCVGRQIQLALERNFGIESELVRDKRPNLVIRRDRHQLRCLGILWYQKPPVERNLREHLWRLMTHKADKALDVVKSPCAYAHGFLPF